MVAAGIVKIAEDGKYLFPKAYNKKVLELWGQISTVIPIFSEAFPELEKVISSPHGPNETLKRNLKYRTWAAVLESSRKH